MKQVVRDLNSELEAGGRWRGSAMKGWVALLGSRLQDKNSPAQTSGAQFPSRFG